jgi:hypothetical protein
MQSGASGSFPQAYYMQPPTPFYDQRRMSYLSNTHSPAGSMFCPHPYAQAPYYPYEQETPMHQAPYYNSPTSTCEVHSNSYHSDSAKITPACSQGAPEAAPSAAHSHQTQEIEGVICSDNAPDNDMADLENELMRLLEETESEEKNV